VRIGGGWMVVGGGSNTSTGGSPPTWMRSLPEPPFTTVSKVAPELVGRALVLST